MEPSPIRILNKLWYLRVYPRGHRLSRTDKTLVSCFLTTGNEKSSSSSQTRTLSSDDFEFSFRIRNWRMFPKRCGFRSNVAYGFMGHTRENILQKGLQEDGSLVVEVALEFWPQSSKPQFMTWYSNKKQKRNAKTKSLDVDNNLALQLFRSPEFSDISFRVGQTTFRAHKCVLALRARTLLELSLGDENDEETAILPNNPIPIPNVNEDVFRAFLDYVYTSNQDHLREFLESSTKDSLLPILSLLEAADKFGAIDLKSFLESLLANEILSPTKCCEMLLLADSHWCTILKEKAMDLFCADPMASIEGSGWKLLEESPKLLSELLIRSAKTIAKNNCTHNQYHTMGDLWDRLEVARLGTDGTR